MISRAILRRSLVVMVLLIAWEASYRFGFLNPMIFGSPSLIIKAGINDGLIFLQASAVTFEEILGAVAIAWTLGVAIGVVFGQSAYVSKVSLPIFSSVMAVPLVILYPLLVAWFGIGEASKIAFGAILGIFPIATNTTIGVQAIQQGYKTLSRALGATRGQSIIHMIIPLAMPSVIHGLRLGTSLIIGGVILAEMLAATNGLGFWISYQSSLFNMGDVFLSVILAICLTISVNLVLTRIEKKYIGQNSTHKTSKNPAA